MHFGVYSLLLLAAAANGWLLAALLLAPAGRHVASPWLAALVATLALRTMPYVLGYAGAYDLHFALTFAPFDLTLAWGPLLWVYVTTLATGTPPRRAVRHFAPALAQLAYQLVCFALPVEAKRAWYTGAHLELVEPVGATLVLLSVGGYSVAAWRVYEQWQRWLDQNVSNREESRLGWLRLILLGMAGTGALGAVMMLVHATLRPLDYFARLPIIVAIAVLTYVAGLLGFRFGRGAIVMTLRADAPLGDAPVGDSPLGDAPLGDAPVSDAPLGDSPAGTSPYAEQAVAWRARVVAARWHHDSQLTLTTLAAALGTSPRTLSRTLNEGLGQSFNAFVNGLRVQDAIDRLRQPGAPDVLRVAMDVGFASKASFNRAFQVHAGTTPTAVRAGQMGVSAAQDPPNAPVAPSESSETPV
jgi:AraC-like DNA-binding protein